MRCWLHKWEKWGKPYVWRGKLFYVTPGMTHTSSEDIATELRQSRTCVRCGKTEDRIVRNG